MEEKENGTIQETLATFFIRSYSRKIFQRIKNIFMVKVHLTQLHN